MSNIALKGYVVNNIDFVNELKGAGKLELKNELKYNVKYSEAESKCMGECRFKVYHVERPDLFTIEINLRGFFDYDANMDKKEVHNETYNQLFPYVRSLISTITVNCGMPPIVVPKIEIDTGNVIVQEGRKNNEFYS